MSPYHKIIPSYNVAEMQKKTDEERKMRGGAEGEGTTEDETVGWHLRLSDEFEQTPGDGGGQRSLVPCSPWGHKESGKIWRLNSKQQ